MSSIEEKLSSLIGEILSEFNNHPEDMGYTLELIRRFSRNIYPALNRIESKTVDSIINKVNKLRDTRIDSGFSWNGMRFQSRPSDRENIMGASALAMAYIGAGGSPDETKWADQENDFEWILENNGRTILSAGDVISLFQAGVAFKSAQTFYARALKDAISEADDPSTVDIINGWPE